MKSNPLYLILLMQAEENVRLIGSCYGTSMRAATIAATRYNLLYNRHNSKPKTQFTAVGWDFDGTLVQLDLPRFVNAANDTFKELGIKKRCTLQELLVSPSIKSYFCSVLDGRIEVEDAEKRFRENFMKYEVNNRLMPGAVESLERIKRLGLPQFIVSNLDAEILKRRLKMLQIDRFFRVVIGANDGFDVKPCTDSLAYALYSVGVSPGPGVLYIGDSRSDVQYATALGCRGVFVGAMCNSMAGCIVIPGLQGMRDLLHQYELSR